MWNIVKCCAFFFLYRNVFDIKDAAPYTHVSTQRECTDTSINKGWERERHTSLASRVDTLVLTNSIHSVCYCRLAKLYF